MAHPTMDTNALARELLAAYTNGEPIPAPFSAQYADFDLDAAYAVEAEFRRLREAAGHKRAGLKVGYANKAMWRALKLETLVWASMYDDTVHTGSSELSLAHYLSPRIEPEIVFKLKDSTAVEWMALGFEIIDCPFPGWQFKPADFVAAFGLHKALVVGPPVSFDPAMADQLATFTLRLLKNGQLVEEGSGRNSLRSPALCLAELAAAVLKRTGKQLESGEIISTGTLTAAQPIAPGELWQAEVDGLPPAQLSLALRV